MNRSKDKKSPGPVSGYQRALGLLARREHSARELRTKLTTRGIDADEAAAAIGRLAEQRYQSDARFAEVLARNRAGQGYGPHRIRAELRSHGLDDATVQAALESLDTDWMASAKAQLDRRRGGKAQGDAAERARYARFLLRRGFDAATVRAITRADVDVPGDGFD